MFISDTLTEPLNPDVYLNHLPPPEAIQIEVSRNVMLAVFGATIWDTMAYIWDDVKLIKRSKFHFVIVCFIISRLSAIGYVLSSALFRDVPIENLEAGIIGSGVMAAISMIASSYLFLRRLQAIYIEHKWVQRTFFVLWIILSGSEILIPIATSPIYIPGTKYMLAVGVQPYTSLSLFMLLFYDTSVLIAVSYKILWAHNTIPGEEQVPWYALVSGRTLPQLSRAVFRGGRQYYLLTVGMTILVGISTSLPSIPPIYKTMFPTASVPLMATMACRVFRNTKMFDLRATTYTAEIRMVNIPGA